MSDRKASRTALGAAYMRAVHQLFDAQPRILDDPFALSLQPALFSEFNIFLISKLTWKVIDIRTAVFFKTSLQVYC